MAKSPEKITPLADQDSPVEWATDAREISVRTAAGSHWRAGRPFSIAPSVIAKADLTPAEASAILADKRLMVTEIFHGADETEAEKETARKV